jgi:hypothetical protein
MRGQRRDDEAWQRWAPLRRDHNVVDGSALAISLIVGCYLARIYVNGI